MLTFFIRDVGLRQDLPWLDVLLILRARKSPKALPVTAMSGDGMIRRSDEVSLSLQPTDLLPSGCDLSCAHFTEQLTKAFITKLQVPRSLPPPVDDRYGSHVEPLYRRDFNPLEPRASVAAFSPSQIGRAHV